MSIYLTLWERKRNCKRNRKKYGLTISLNLCYPIYGRFDHAEDSRCKGLIQQSGA